MIEIKLEKWILGEKYVKGNYLVLGVYGIFRLNDNVNMKINFVRKNWIRRNLKLIILVFW